MVQAFLFIPVMVMLSVTAEVRSDGATAAADAKSPCVSHVLTPAVAELRRKTRVPLRLPGVLRDADDAGLYAEVRSAAPARYRVRVGQHCERSYCPYATLSGVRLNGREARPRGAAVQLAGGVRAYFRDGSKRLVDSVITWDEGEYRYEIKVYAADEAAIVKVAASAITCDGGR